MKWQKSDSGILQSGDIFEKYTVEKLLGKGGMGAVYLVRHNILDSLFALKVLFPEVAARNKQFVDRFIREAKLACKIKHPNLIAVHDAGRNPDNGMYYLVMDYVSGGSVRELLKKNGKISLDRAVSIAEQVASALEAAGQHHMVHRDIKPDNIMFAADGSVKLADLGIAKSTNEQDTMLTMEASVFGTPAYMSPEQAMDSRNVDPRADIYSLGIVLFEMVSGERPYRGESTIEILSQVVKNEDIPDVRTVCSSVPESVAHLIADMTEKKLQNRIPSPSALLARIHDLMLLPDEPVIPSIEQPHTGYADVTMPTLVKPERSTESEEGHPSAKIEPAPEVTMPTLIRSGSKQVPASAAIHNAADEERTVPAPQINTSGIKDSSADAVPPETPAEVTMPTIMKQAVPEKTDAVPPETPAEVTMPTIMKQAVPEKTVPQVSPEACPDKERQNALERTQNIVCKGTAISSSAGYPVQPLQSGQSNLEQRRQKILLAVAGALCIVIVLGCIINSLLHKEPVPVNVPSAPPVQEQQKKLPVSTVNPSRSERTVSVQAEKKTALAPLSSPCPPEAELESDELVNDAVIILSGATETAEKIRNDLKKNCRKPVVFLKAESLYSRQMKNIIRHKPCFVVLIPSAWWSEAGRTRATFEMMLKEEVNLLRDNQVNFAFILDPEDSENPEIAGFNQAIKELCSLRSFDYFEADSSNWQTLGCTAKSADTGF